MNTNALKRFATESRKLLMKGVQSRLEQIGFKPDGSFAAEPTLSGKVTVLYGKIVGGPDFYNHWQELRRQIERHGVKEVVEQAAYTWFNRFMAIRILDRNNLAPDILQYENHEVRLPKIVTDARAGKTPVLNEAQRKALNEVIFDGSKTYEQFSVLIQAYCENNAILRSCFGGITDYTMLLLPPDILGEGNFIDLLNETSSLIDRDDYKKPELIGWLYQFYISDKKDEVFAKKGGYESDEIPAATQIFTPNWIVKYMVENTLGRIYLDNNPGSHLAENWKYLVNYQLSNTNYQTEDSILRYSSLEELTCADLSCGSGHILNEMFDLLYQLYEEDFYSPRQAIEAIFRKNMIGIDIDVRAQQLATFALLLKACQRDSAFTDGHCLPRIYTVPEILPNFTPNYLYDICQCYGGLHDYDSKEKEKHVKQIEKALELIKDADVLGSIIKFDIDIYLAKAMAGVRDEWSGHVSSGRGLICDDATLMQMHPQWEIVQLFGFISSLSLPYAALCMNPPYLVPSKNTVLAKYAKANYPNSCSDMATIFVEVMGNLSCKNGQFTFIIPPSWMFLSTFTKFRKDLIDNYSIQSLLHLSRGVFGADFGSSSAVIKKAENGDFKGTYFRLIERTFQEFDQKHLQELFEKVLENHEFKYLFKDYSKDITSIEYSEAGAKIYYDAVNQKQFEQIPGSPIAYWINSKLLKLFKNKSIKDIAEPRVGMATADNERFIRLWHEINHNDLGLNIKSRLDAIKSNLKWFPFTKGGTYRKWYGNNEYVVNWKNDGNEIRNFSDPITGRIRSHNYNLEYIFKEGITWGTISSGYPTFRYCPIGFLYSNSGYGMFFSNVNHIKGVLGLLNSPIVNEILKFLSPGIGVESGYLRKIPISDAPIAFENLIDDCINIAQLDWDAHETSWDFETNPLIAEIEKLPEETGIFTDAEGNYEIIYPEHVRNDAMIEKRKGTITLRPQFLKSCFISYSQKWTKLFAQLHSNEEEINRRFIEIYGLQDEMDPYVPFDEIAILQQNEASVDYDDVDGAVLIWNKDVIIKQLISYAVGCMMGRYRLDRPGLAIAHPNPSAEEIAEYVAPQTGKLWWIDDDGIVPMMDDDCGFHDNASNRFSEFIEAVFGTDSKTENLNFVREAIGKDIIDYFRNNFYADHKKMYQNRPIYWMFSSNQNGGRAAFQCLVYMHRMHRFTPEHIRTNYLLPYIETLAAREADLNSRTSLTARENNQLNRIKADLEECREYQLRLHDFADQQIEIDLDDGVVKNYATFASVLAKLK